ncbi:fimbrial protein [Salmonella enterica subsp. enterica]|nr:fimbrial protein [Salmonella enterica]ELJ2931534.1 fimbrial protein [Salmonella enterica subsp. enterica]
MKKIILASAISMAMFSGATMAAQSGQVTFLGSVTNTTCDLVASTNGAEKNQIELGVVSINSEAQQGIPFALVKGADAQCTGLTGKVATIAWAGNLGDEGVLNQSAHANAATGAWVRLTPKNAKANNDIKKGSDTVVFDADKLDNDGGFKFEAKLNGKATPGEFRSVISYAVAYN